jgi:hypothetical protein
MQLSCHKRYATNNKCNSRATEDTQQTIDATLAPQKIRNKQWVVSARATWLWGALLGVQAQLMPWEAGVKQRAFVCTIHTGSHDHGRPSWMWTSHLGTSGMPHVKCPGQLRLLFTYLAHIYINILCNIDYVIYIMYIGYIGYVIYIIIICNTSI